MTQSLQIIAGIALVFGPVCALVIVIDLLAGHAQHIWITNLVWPITALYGGPLTLGVILLPADCRHVTR